MTNEVDLVRVAAIFHPNREVLAFTEKALSSICTLCQIVPFFQFGQLLLAIQDVKFDLIIMHWHDESRNDAPLRLREQGLANCPLVVTSTVSTLHIPDFGFTEDEKRFDAAVATPIMISELRRAVETALLIWNFRVGNGR